MNTNINGNINTNRTSNKINLKIFVLGLFLITGLVVGFYPFIQGANAKTTHTVEQNTPAISPARPKIQLAILLDTSSSMSGLIDQARNQLWQVVNEFSESTRNGVVPLLEVAVYEYGNSGLSSSSGYTRQVTDLTSELDQVSEALFSLTTNGGDEYCGYAISTAVANLQWSDSDSDIRAIFIAGNEPFTQGPVSFKQAIASAQSKDIAVNTIHAGSYEAGVQTGWEQGALLAGGSYMSIDHNHQVAHVVAPQDRKIAQLNAKLNGTYIPYGKDGANKAQRQIIQDTKSNGISLGLLAKRAKSKISSMYRNSSWDLVDALEEGKVDLDDLEEDQMPAEMRSMDEPDRQKYVAKKAREREEIKSEILAQSKEREDYVAAAKAAAPATTVATMNDALGAAIRKQGEKKDYVFEAAE